MDSGVVIGIVLLVAWFAFAMLGSWSEGRSPWVTLGGGLWALFWLAVVPGVVVYFAFVA